MNTRRRRIREVRKGKRRLEGRTRVEKHDKRANGINLPWIYITVIHSTYTPVGRALG